MRLGDAWATSPRSFYSIREPTRPGPRPISIGPRHIRDLSTSSATAVTATEGETDEDGSQKGMKTAQAYLELATAQAAPLGRVALPHRRAATQLPRSRPRSRLVARVPVAPGNSDLCFI